MCIHLLINPNLCLDNGTLQVLFCVYAMFINELIYLWDFEHNMYNRPHIWGGINTKIQSVKHGTNKETNKETVRSMSTWRDLT